ncbi:MAG: ABC transporter permease [Planctomycetes bacterium]|nr:ABC transporter permease [Planctomycetota bacterium]
MRNILLITRKEFRSFFNLTIGYVFIVVYLLFTNGLFFYTLFLNNIAEMRYYFGIMPWVFLFFVAAITMRLWAEERKQGTLELLLTWPVRDYEVVIGKYLASVLLILLTLVLSINVPITLALLGKPDFGPIIGGYIGAALLGASYAAVGTCISSLTENQIIAFLLTIFILAVSLIAGWLAQIFGSLGTLLYFLSPATHFESIARGVIDSRDVIYYLSVIFFFLFLNNFIVVTQK